MRGTARYEGRRAASQLPGALGAAAAVAAILVCGALPAGAVTEQECLDLVRNRAALMYRVPLGNVAVKWDGPRLANMAENVPREAKISLGGSLYRLSGTMPVPIEVWHKGTRVATLFPRLTIDVRQEVVVASGRITRGSILGDTAVRLEKRPVTSLANQPFVSLSGVVGMGAKQDISAGTVLTAAMIESVPVVKGGAMVSVRLVSGDITILTSGQVLQDGRPGQLVRVLNTKSQRDFLARVVRQDLVEVRLEGEEE